MRVFFPVLFSLLSIGLVSWAEIYLLKKLHRDWWAYTFVRMAAWGVPFTGALAIGLWTAGIFLDTYLVLVSGAYLASASLIVGLALLLSLPISGVLHWAAHAAGRTKEERLSAREQPETSTRRKFLKTASVIVPGVTIMAGSKGIAESLYAPETPEIPLYFANLPPDLEGFRIVQISDVHVGLFITMNDFEIMVEKASVLNADLTVLTGDFSDDAPAYLDALRLAAQIPSRYGLLASIGNHEYFRGIDQIVRAYDKSTIPLLRNAGTTIRVGQTDLYIAGADDPRSLGALSQPFFRETIDAAINEAPAGSFTVLLSHRPEGFLHASERGIPLTLSGHTHGGQIGIGGRSVMEWFGREYMWGHYRKNGSQLYTTAGAGHWFPFRLGCPAEIPVYVLKSL